MASNVAQLFSFQPRSRDWSNQELAEFYRVESSLVQAGLKVDTDRGLTDENEPWFVFCNSDTGEVIIHFARIDGAYVAASGAFEGVLRGLDFRSVVEALLNRHPLVVPQSRSNIKLHPSSLLVALVATAFFKLSEVDAQASEANDNGHGDTASKEVWIKSDGDIKQSIIQLDRRHVAVILAAMTFAVSHDFNGDWSQWTHKASEWLAQDADAGSLAAHVPMLVSDLIEFAGLDETAQVGRADMKVHASLLPVDGSIEQFASLFGEKLSLVSLLSSLMASAAPAEKEAVAGPSLPGTIAAVEDLSTFRQELEQGGSAGSSDAPLRVVDHERAPAEHKAEKAEVVTVVLSQTEPKSDGSTLPAVEAVRYVETKVLTLTDSREIMHLNDGLLTSLTATTNEVSVDSEPMPETSLVTSAAPEAREIGALAAKIEAMFGDNRPAQAYHDTPAGHKDVLATFQERNADFEVAFSGNDVVFYDLTPEYHDGDTLGFVTWKFSDGSTLSLIGVMPHELVAAA